MILEALLKKTKSFDAETPFQDGKAPKKLKRKWWLPLKSRKARKNPGSKSSKVGRHNVPTDAVEMYRLFNGCEPDSLEYSQTWLPDEHSPLVALGEGDCPFIGYSSAKSSKDGNIEDYIHHFGEEGGDKPRLFVTQPPKGFNPVLMIIGGDWEIEIRGDGKLWLVN